MHSAPPRFFDDYNRRRRFLKGFLLYKRNFNYYVEVKGGKQADNKNFLWRDEVGVFFDNAGRHDSQRPVSSRAG